MTATAEVRPIKRRRRTKAEIEQLHLQMIEVLEGDHPQSVRHVFYRMTDPTLPEPVEKSDKGYRTVQEQLVRLRRAGKIPYGWITDATRRGYFVETHDSMADAATECARYYRRSVWRDTPVYVEVWCESRSIAGVIEQETRRYAVPLYPSGGFSSLSLASSAAENMDNEADGRPIHILYIGDYDPAGLLIPDRIDDELRLHIANPGSLQFHRLAITPEQIKLMGLPGKPSKDRRGGWRENQATVEAEAMPAGKMRQILRDAIESFIDPDILRVTEEAETSEREILRNWADALAKGEHLGWPS